MPVPEAGLLSCDIKSFPTHKHLCISDLQMLETSIAHSTYGAKCVPKARCTRPKGCLGSTPRGMATASRECAPFWKVVVLYESPFYLVPVFSPQLLLMCCSLNSEELLSSLCLSTNMWDTKGTGRKIWAAQMCFFRASAQLVNRHLLLANSSSRLGLSLTSAGKKLSVYFLKLFIIPLIGITEMIFWVKEPT